MDGDGTAGEPAEIHIERLAVLTSEARGRILEPLGEPGTLEGFAMNARYVALALSVGGEREGGLIAQTYWEWLHLEVVAVPQRWRGLALGRRLIEAAEAIALTRGCHSAWVDTYSFQAPGFYEAVGFKPFGRLPNYPEGGERIFYSKRLTPAGEDNGE